MKRLGYLVTIVSFPKHRQCFTQIMYSPKYLSQRLVQIQALDNVPLTTALVTTHKMATDLQKSKYRHVLRQTPKHTVVTFENLPVLKNE